LIPAVWTIGITPPEWRAAGLIPAVWTIGINPAEYSLPERCQELSFFQEQPLETWRYLRDDTFSL
jgi:hypothetical protein